MSKRMSWLALIYWVIFGIFLYSDLYLSRPNVGLLIKALFPLACLANLFGLVMALSLWKVRRREAAGLLLLNGPPLAAVAYGIWWLFFGLKI
ncbi:MAG: hypothetical protein KJ726_07295 [Verrucomicrobia bacterium]|nr:hypothetical protein [Verrucomicrobiota bacterium]MBU1909832.1 hypothetical protein [Verrucomicrobiota bacterium]